MPATDSSTPRRPLPELTIATQFFWTSGQDGRLRFQRCADCGELRHPPGPRCRTCRSDRTEISTVSGRATVVAATINEHQWLRDFDPPYVVAIVAIDEDRRVRLTTNIVGCAPDDVHLGMAVQVRFESHDDVWIPVFEPALGSPDVVDLPEQPQPAAVRPMIRSDKFERHVALTGLGMSQVGRRLMRDPVGLAIDACLAAIDDAGLTLDDIDGLSTYPGSAPGGHSEGGIQAVADALGLAPTWHSGGGETPGQTGSVVNAMLAVSAGLCRHVLCFRTVWESTHAELAKQRRGAGAGSGGRVGGDIATWRFPYGAMSAANWIAMCASQHFHRFGTTRESLGWIALNARNNAALNETAIYREPLTMDDYLSARIISTPFGLYDCDVPCDGSVAVIVSARDTAGDLRQPAVLVEAVGTQIRERVSWDQGTLVHEPLVDGPAEHLWSRTELTPADVDVAELYDGFTFNCLTWIEALGFCGVGEGGDFVEGGRRIALDGDLPLNTHGGQLSGGRLHGYSFLTEAMQQLRGAAATRQVPRAEVAVVATGGGTPGGCMLLTAAN